jgi:hypothetical protein
MMIATFILSVKLCIEGNADIQHKVVVNQLLAI